MYKINFFLALAISINVYANNDYKNFECYSTDPELGDSAHWATASIDPVSYTHLRAHET